VYSICLLLVAWALFFWPILTAQRAFPPGDFYDQFYAFARFELAELAAGRLPLWNPYTFSGHPFLADIQSAIFYPPSLLTVAAGLRLGFSPYNLELEAVAHFFLASLFTYLLGRRLFNSNFAALVAALTFTYGGYLTGYPPLQLAILETGIWLPLVLLLLDLSVERRALVGFMAAGLVLGIAFLAGHPQTAMYMVYTAVIYLVCQSVSPKLSLSTLLHSCKGEAGGGWDAWLKNPLSFLAIFLATALGAAAVQLLPSAEFTRLSVRAETTYEMVSGGFPLKDIVQIVRPGMVSHFSPLYVGLLPLLLALVALVVRRERRVFAWGAFALVALLLSLGGNAFLYPIFYRLVPGFALFRSQERAAFLFSFAMAILAGYGATWLTARLASWRWSTVLQSALLVMIYLDLFVTNSALNAYPAQPHDLVYTSPLVQTLQSDPDVFRVHNEWRWPGNYGDVYDLEDTWGASPLRLARYDTFVTRLPEVRVWNLLNVKYVLTYRQSLGPGAELLGQEPARPGGPDSHPTYLHRIKAPNPRVYIVHQAEVIPEDTAALTRLRAAEFNPQATAILAEPAPLDLPGRPLMDSGAGIVEREPRRLVVNARLVANGLLMLSELDYPGWRATVDGQPAPILRADVILRAVPLTAGTHRVEMVFDPPSVKWGMWLSAATWLIGAVVLLRGASSPQNSPPNPPILGGTREWLTDSPQDWGAGGAGGGWALPIEPQPAGGLS